MSLINRMGAIVGDQNNVARYLFEKVGHTSFIALAIYCLTRGRVPLFTAAVIAAALYLVLAKVVDHWGKPLPRALFWSFLRDCFFDGVVVCGLVAVVAAVPLLTWPHAIIAFVIWVAVFLVLDNNSWGSPS